MATPAITPSALATLTESTELGVGLAAAYAAPIHSYYLQGLGGVTEIGGPFAKAELGAHLTTSLSTVATLGWERETGVGAGAGLRWDF